MPPPKPKTRPSSTPSRLWSALESISTLAGVEAEWRAQLGWEFDALKTLFRQKPGLATSFPHPNGGLPYEVVSHADGTYVGVCHETKDRIELRKSHLVVYEVDRPTLAQNIATSFAFPLSGMPREVSRHFFSLGSATIDKTRVDVYFLIPFRSGDVLEAVAAVPIPDPHPLLLTVPTLRFCSAEVIGRIRNKGSHVLALEDCFQPSNRGEWRMKETGLHSLRWATPTLPKEPTLSSRGQCLLTAMSKLGAVDTDHLRTTAEIVKRAFGTAITSDSVKSVMAELAAKGLIRTKFGRGGGAWLTPTGLTRVQLIEGTIPETR